MRRSFCRCDAAGMRTVSFVLWSVLKCVSVRDVCHSPPTSAGCPSFHPARWAAFSHLQRGRTFLPLKQTQRGHLSNMMLYKTHWQPTPMILKHITPQWRTAVPRPVHCSWELDGHWARLLCRCDMWMHLWHFVVVFFHLIFQGAWSQRVRVVFTSNLRSFHHIFNGQHVPTQHAPPLQRFTDTLAFFLRVWQQWEHTAVYTFVKKKNVVKTSKGSAGRGINADPRRAPLLCGHGEVL